MQRLDERERVEESDALLAIMARDGYAAFEALYERYAHRVQRYILASLGHAAEVEDLTSTVFLRAMARIETYRVERGSFAAWLFGIARNVVRDERRAAARARGVVRLTERIGDLRPGPEQVSLAREQQEVVRRTMAMLTAEQRDALALRYFAELSFEEVAAALGKSVPAAKMLTKRGLGALQRNLERSGA